MDHSIDSVYLYVYQFSLDLAGCPRTIADTKKPAGLAPCGLLGLHRITLVITNGEFWCCREFNPRPKFLHSYAGHLKTISYQLNQGAVVSRLHAITMVKTLCGQFVDQHEKLNLD